MNDLLSFNYWNKQVDKGFARSAQAVLKPKNKITTNSSLSCESCGQGECNCGGSCNGECAQ